jgi:transglutaminase-like putative cysteine protease
MAEQQTRRSFLLQCTAGTTFLTTPPLRQMIGEKAMASPPGQEVSETKSVVRSPDFQRFSVRHRGTIINRKADLTSLELWLPVPLNHREQQVESFSMSPKVPLFLDPHRRFAVARMYRSRNLPKPGETVQLEINYELLSRAIQVDTKRASEFSFGEYPEEVRDSVFLKPESKVESRSREIRQAADKLRGASSTPWETALKIYHWILEQTDYQLIEGFGGARYCLANRHGECGDYSALFVALCRVLGIPARGVIGAWADGTDQWHVWAEFMLPSGDWIPVDLSIGDDARFPERHFGMLEPKRIVLAKSFDIVLAKVEQGHKKLKFLQSGAFYYHARQISEPPRTEFHLESELTRDAESNIGQTSSKLQGAR